MISQISDTVKLTAHCSRPHPETPGRQDVVFLLLMREGADGGCGAAPSSGVERLREGGREREGGDW